MYLMLMIFLTIYFCLVPYPLRPHLPVNHRPDVETPLIFPPPVNIRPATHSAPGGILQRGSSLSVLVLRLDMRLGVWRDGAGVRGLVVPDAGGLRPGSVSVSPCSCSSIFVLDDLCRCF